MEDLLEVAPPDVLTATAWGIDAAGVRERLRAIPVVLR